jgi:hypothetical protein
VFILLSWAYIMPYASLAYANTGLAMSVCGGVCVCVCVCVSKCSHTNSQGSEYLIFA